MRDICLKLPYVRLDSGPLGMYAYVHCASGDRVHYRVGPRRTLVCRAWLVTGLLRWVPVAVGLGGKPRRCGYVTQVVWQGL